MAMQKKFTCEIIPLIRILILLVHFSNIHHTESTLRTFRTSRRVFIFHFAKTINSVLVHLMQMWMLIKWTIKYHTSCMRLNLVLAQSVITLSEIWVFKIWYNVFYTLILYLTLQIITLLSIHTINPFSILIPSSCLTLSSYLI